MGLRGQAVAVLATAAVAAAAVGLLQASRENVYEATSLVQLDVAPSVVAASGGRPENIVFLTRSYSARASTTPVLERAIAAADLDVDADEARERLSVEVSNADATVSVRTTGPSRADAESLNSAVVDSLTEAVAQEQEDLRGERLAPIQEQLISLEQRLPTLESGSPQRAVAEQQFAALAQARAEAQLQPLNRVSLLSPAEAADDPVAPRPVRAALLTLLVAAVVGAQLLAVLSYLRRSRSGDGVTRSAAAQATSEEPSATTWAPQTRPLPPAAPPRPHAP